MKTIQEFRFPLLVLICSIIIALFTSYGNKQVHPDLNELMVAAFLKLNNKGDFSQPEFKKYTFYFLQGATLKGTAIIKDGFFSANDVAAAGFGYGYSEEGPAEMIPKFWISHGGYSADVPEVPASLRHFYDPTKTAGNRYLTDIADAKIMGSLQKYVLTNPHTDGVQWALGTPGDLSADVQSHQYTWERGKAWMQLALKETDKDKKDGYMAKAWRSLGETLHMIADNGCPPHVRNDAHPSPVWANNTWFGDPDPYEEFIDIIRTEDPAAFVNLAKGSPDAALKSRFEKMNKAVDIAHALAVFTNTSFVTGETISGKDKNGVTWKQRTHPGDEYKSPQLENMKYDADNYTYTYASGIKQCTDHYYFAELIPKICDPYVDIECVESQAEALFPNIIEAGKKVISLYIPKLRVDIKSAEKNVVKGEITHMTDAEYASEIKYNGKVKLQLIDKKYKIKKEIEVMARNGLFESNELSFGNTGDKVIALIEFGGITVQSENFEYRPAAVSSPAPVGKQGASIGLIVIYVEGSFDKEFNCAGYDQAARIWIDLETRGLPISSGLGSFKGSRREGNYFEEITGIISEERIVELRFRGTKEFGCREQQWDVTVKDIPRINQETDVPGMATYVLAPYDINLERNRVDMAAHVPIMSLNETCLENRQLTRSLIETAWNSKVVGSTIMESPKIQKSHISIIVYR